MTSRTSKTAAQRAGRITALSATAAFGLAVTTLAAPAWAHDSLIASSPEAGEVLEQSPEEVTLEFSGEGLTDGESITNVIQISDAEGENFEGETEIDGATMSTELPEELPGGEYTVAYRVVYSDGHAEEQSFDFGVAEAEPTPQAEAETGSESAQPQATEDDGAAESNGDEPAAEDSTADPAADAEATAETDSGLPVGVSVVAGIVILALFAGIVLAVLRGRGKRRP